MPLDINKLKQIQQAWNQRTGGMQPLPPQQPQQDDQSALGANLETLSQPEAVDPMIQQIQSMSPEELEAKKKALQQMIQGGQE